MPPFYPNRRTATEFGAGAVGRADRNALVTGALDAYVQVGLVDASTLTR